MHCRSSGTTLKRQPSSGQVASYSACYSLRETHQQPLDLKILCWNQCEGLLPAAPRSFGVSIGHAKQKIDVGVAAVSLVGKAGQDQTARRGIGAPCDEHLPKLAYQAANTEPQSTLCALALSKSKSCRGLIFVQQGGKYASNGGFSVRASFMYKYHLPYYRPIVCVRR